MIHPTAIIHPKAELHETASIGPYAVIEAGVTVGAGCEIGPHVHLTGETTLGKNNRLHTGAVIGDAPQDLKYNDEPTRLRIGEDNVIREHVTLHRSNSPDEDTVIGSHNFFMAHSHVGHNAVVGDHNIFANGALVGGHAVISDRVFLSGNCAVHQFVRIGTLAMMQGNAAVSQDLPPFTMVFGVNKLCGLNIVGLRRAGIGRGGTHGTEGVLSAGFFGRREGGGIAGGIHGGSHAGIAGIHRRQRTRRVRAREPQVWLSNGHQRLADQPALEADAG